MSRLLPVVLTGLFLLVGCAGSERTATPAPVEMPEAAPTGPAFTTFIFDNNQLTQQDLRTGSEQAMALQGRYLGPKAISPDGRRLAFVYFWADSTRLALLDLNTQTAKPVYATPGEATFTLAWHQKGDRLAFGHFLPRRTSEGVQMGNGDLLTVRADGIGVFRVGCSVSKAVHVWLPSGSLIVGDGKNLYEVGPEGCATLATLPAQKLHHVTYAPDGTRLAYIKRDLEYNRTTRQYEPDSTLTLATYIGANPQEIVGDDYRARNLAWKPDGTELAFDVRSPDNAQVRLILLLEAATGKSYYLNQPGEQGNPSDTHPAWSPDGERLAYLRTYPDGTRLLQVRTFSDLTTGTTTLTELAPGDQWAGWVDEQTALLRRAQGTMELHAIGQAEPIASFPASQTFLVAWPQ